MAASPGWLPTRGATLAAAPASPGPVLAMGGLPRLLPVHRRSLSRAGCPRGTETTHLVTNQPRLWSQTALCSDSKLDQPLPAVWPRASYSASLCLGTFFTNRNNNCF